MNHATRVIGDATSVKERFATFGAVCRAEKLMDVVAFNNTGAQGDGAALYLQVFSIATGPVVAPVDTTVPTFSFPVFSKTGGVLGQCADMMGIYCCWSTTPDTKTIVAAVSGSIVIKVKA